MTSKRIVLISDHASPLADPGSVDSGGQNVIDFIKKQPEAYALVHANFWMSAMVAANMKKALRIPFVVTFHSRQEARDN